MASPTATLRTAIVNNTVSRQDLQRIAEDAIRAKHSEAEGLSYGYMFGPAAKVIVRKGWSRDSRGVYDTWGADVILPFGTVVSD